MYVPRVSEPCLPTKVSVPIIRQQTANIERTHQPRSAFEGGSLSQVVIMSEAERVDAMYTDEPWTHLGADFGRGEK